MEMMKALLQKLHEQLAALNVEGQSGAGLIKVTVNGKTVFDAKAQPSLATLMKWAARDNDRTMLYAAEIKIKLK